MKKTIRFSGILVFILSLFVPFRTFAATTVTVDENKVTVDQNQPQTVVVQNPPVVVAKVVDPRELEGEIIRVDYTGNMIVIQDINGRERKVLLKQGMINGYKVGDYVKIYLMADLKEAKTITTKYAADLEGDITGTDLVNSRIVVHAADGRNVVVVVNPNLMNQYKAGDHVKLYIVSDYADLQEARMIRVR